jgi:hypothetical protein
MSVEDTNASNITEENHSSNLEPATKRLKNSDEDDHENSKETIPNQGDKTNDEATAANSSTEEKNATNMSKSTGDTVKADAQSSGATSAKVPIEVQIHEYMHLYFDEAGNQLHQYSTSNLEERFIDANGQIAPNIDPSQFEKQGLVRRDFFHIHHSQIPSAILKNHLSREDIERNSVDLYKNTVERVQHPGMPTYGYGGGYADPYHPQHDYAQSYPPGGETSSLGFYHHNTPSPRSQYTPIQSTNLPPNSSDTGQDTKQEETVNGKEVSQSSIRSEDDATKKEEEHSETGKDKDKKSTLPNNESHNHPVPPYQPQSMQGTFQGYPPYNQHFSNGLSPSQSNDNRLMYDRGQMYRPDMYPMNLHRYPTQMPYVESGTERDGYQPYQQYPPMYSHYPIRTSPEHHRNPVTGVVPNPNAFNSPPFLGAPTHEINENDVLCGRGGTTNQHIGNKKFRNLVKQHQESYLKCKKKDKPAISSKIVKMIREMNPPGRFLKQEGNAGEWFDVGDARATEKVSQALREGAPAIRKALEGSKADDNGHANQSIRPAAFEVKSSVTSGSRSV